MTAPIKRPDDWQKREAVIEVRATPAEKARFMAAARGNLSKFVRKVLERASRKR